MEEWGRQGAVWEVSIPSPLPFHLVNTLVHTHVYDSHPTLQLTCPLNTNQHPVGQEGRKEGWVGGGDGVEEGNGGRER